MTMLAELFPVALPDRPLRFPEERGSPADLLRQECGRIASAARASEDRLLGTLALSVFQLGKIREDYTRTADPQPHVADALEILQANLDDVLQEHRVRVIDLTGEELTEQLRGQVQIRARESSAVAQVPRVIHMEEPVVLRHGKLIAEGVVTVETPAE
jgi:hypothetical protein